MNLARQRPRRHARRRPARRSRPANVDLDAATYAARRRSPTPGRYVALAVTDTGDGMDAETPRPHLRALLHHQGAGQGHRPRPRTVYGIVKQSGGGIGVESEPGQGTTFRIYLPRVDD